MCLAIPMQVTQVDGFNARCASRGVERDVNLFLLQGEEIAVGDFVLIHVGYAIQKLSAEDAETSQALFDEWFETAEAESDA